MAGNTIYVKGSYIDIHDNGVVNLSVDKGEVHVGDRQQPKPQCAVGEELVDSEPWLKVKQAGLVDADGMPTVSRPEAALMADKLAQLLGIANKWKYFEQLWHRNNMRNDYNTALNQVKSLEFQDRLKKILD
jgi:hypothetical protein